MIQDYYKFLYVGFIYSIDPFLLLSDNSFDIKNNLF